MPCIIATAAPRKSQGCSGYMALPVTLGVFLCQGSGEVCEHSHSGQIAALCSTSWGVVRQMPGKPRWLDLELFFKIYEKFLSP